MEEADRLRRENEALRAQLARAETEKKRLEVLVMTSPVGVLVVDAGTRTVEFVNQEAERIMGVPPRPGSKLERYQEVAAYHRPDGRKYAIEERPLSRALDRGETVRSEEILLDRPDGGKVTTLVSATPIHSDGGDIMSAVVVIQDMTPLEEMERLRSEFLGMVSHELRSPLTSIKGSAASVLSASSPFDASETREFFRTMDREADRMSNLINSLLDITRIDAGELSVDPEPAELLPLVDAAKNTFLRGGGRHPVEVEIGMDLPPVAADTQRVVQVLNNLLSNAAKYSPDSSPITVTASQTEDGLYSAVTVSDEGAGIPPDRLGRLFEKFSHGDDGERDVTGEGLGLAICKGIVEAHGGRIWAESEGAGRGARFTFTIPIAEEDVAAAPAGPDEGAPQIGPAAGPRNRTRVMAVDDDPYQLRQYRNILSNAGYTYFGTGDPSEVVELIEMHEPHIVLLDLLIPGTNGFDVMKRVREVSDAPVIFLSAHREEKEVLRAFDMGASDYITKSFSPRELLARIEASLRKQAGSGQAQAHKPYRLGGLEIDYANRSVTVSGEPVELTATE